MPCLDPEEEVVNLQNSQHADAWEYAVEAIKADLRSLIRTAAYAECCGVTVNDITSAICGSDELFNSSLRNLLRKHSLPDEIAEPTEGLTFTTRVSQQKTTQFSITFTNTSVILGHETIGKNTSLCLVEYLILKRKPIHYLWAYVILPKFEVKSKTPDEQFRNYVSKVKRKLVEYGIHVATEKEKYSDGTAMFQGMDDSVASNIRDIRKMYDNAVAQYEERDTQGAVNTLSGMTKDIKHQWHIFIDAYMDLASWICELNFEGVQKSVIDSCVEFMGWYTKRLRLGTLKIKRFMRKEALSSQALDVWNSIKKESERAEKLFSLLIERQPLTQDERDYENTVDVMVQFREKLLSVNEESERGVEKGVIAEVVKGLCKTNSLLERLAEYGCDTLDELLEAKHQRQNCSVEYIRDMHERIYWLVGDLIVEIENYDEFERSKGNKLRCLESHLRSRLRQELKSYV